MMNRTVAPPLKTIKHIPLPEIIQRRLSNDISVYEINTGTQEVIKIEFIFFAGRYFEQEKVQGIVTSGLLKEGTKHYSGEAIAENLDYFGCTLSTPYNLDTSGIVVYVLKKHLVKVLPIIRDILLNPVFPEEELKTFILRKKNRLKVDLSKCDVVSYRTITEKIFGSSHPYGYNSVPEDYGQIKRPSLIEHHKRCFNAANGFILLSGKTDGVFELLDDALQNLPRGMKVPPSEQSTVLETPKKLTLDVGQGYQTSIRVGCQLFNRRHPDYGKFYVLNTIFGGYFGSRLMANIREDKGYSYNIFSAVDPMKFGGYFYIGAEISNEFVEDTLSEIYKEMDRIKTELVPEKELNMVKNYLSGIFLTMADGPFNVSDIIKTMVQDELPFSFYNDMIQQIHEITAVEIRALAEQYLQKEKMWEVIVT